MNKLVIYYRVSTDKQGFSGLGLEAQKQMVKFFIKPGDEVLGEFKDIETAKNTNREELLKAIELAKKEDAILIVAVLDRLLRKLSHLIALRESKIKFLAADSPYASEFEINLKVCFYEEELRKVSERTKLALKAKKDRGFTLGTPSNLTQKARLKGSKRATEKAENNENNKRARAVIKLLKAKGMTLQQIADELNISGFKTATGKSFEKMSVSRLIK